MNLFEYIKQVRNHRARMQRWGFVYNVRSKSSQYGSHDYHASAVLRALAVHDLEKWLFLPLLFMFSSGRGNRKVARKVYDVMNGVGVMISAVALCMFSSEARQVARRYERIFDCLDRSLDEVAREELKDGGPPLSNFLRGEDLVEAEAYKVYWPLVVECGVLQY
jgi:hypothetical protein